MVQKSLSAKTLKLRAKKPAAEMERTGMVLVHPFDDHRIICGAGTAALELTEQVPGLIWL